MNDKTRLGSSFDALRKRAERIVKEQGITLQNGDELDILRLAHELEVQQVELGLQNEELQRANKELEASRDAFSDLYESAPVAYVTVNEKGIIEQANEAAARMLSGSKYFLKGRAFSRMVYPEDHEVYFSCLEKISFQNLPASCDLRLMIKEKGPLVHVHLEAAAKHDPQGILRWRLALVDITERKLAEETLRESEERYRALVTASSEVLYRMSPDWSEMRQLHSRGFLANTERPNPNWLKEYIHPDDQPQVIAAINEAIRSRSIFEREHRVLRVDGTLGWTFSRAVPILDGNGEIVEWFGAASDITERIKAEEALRRARDDLEIRVEERTAELKEMNERLERSNQALQEFASIASHDLQEPLRKIQMFGELVRSRYGMELGDEVKAYVSRMNTAAGRMQSLLNALLDYARVTSRGKPFVEVSLNSIVQEVLSDLEARIHQTGGTAEVEPLPMVQADPTQMRQLFQNLIGNALKFHKEDEKPIVKVFSQSGNEQLKILVEDNGIGFDEKYLKMVFSPFQRLHGKSSNYEGTGMGLAICKKIVDRHGGTITAKSTPGKGSTFIIDLPVKRGRKSS
jgi:PAS domain S-box-containing protein